MSDIYNIVNLKIYLFYFVGLYFYLINLNGGEIIKKDKEEDLIEELMKEIENL